MKRTFNFTLIILTLIGCTRNSPSRAVATTTQATQQVPEPTWNVYDPDPNHIWNRVFRQFYLRTAPDGKEYGLGELDPLLWFDTTYLLSGVSYQQALQVLDEFLRTGAENRVAEPLKRAMFQRDLWAVFDWLASQPEPYPSQRIALAARLVQIMKRVALTKDQIRSVPDNYALTVQSKAFSAEFQNDDLTLAFLPANLFQPNSAWVSMGREGGPIAMSHTQGFPFLGHSVFLVLVRSPEGRGETLKFIDSLNSDSKPVLAVGSEVALVRRMLLIDDQGNLVLSPLVETIQIRRFNPEQIFHEFELNRTSLLSGYAQTLKLKTDLFILFSSHGDVFEFHEIPGLQATIPKVCKGCHFENPPLSNTGDIQSLLSYSRRSFPLADNQQPILFATTVMNEAETVIDWKLEHHTWQALRGLWNQ